MKVPSHWAHESVPLERAFIGAEKLGKFIVTLPGEPSEKSMLEYPWDTAIRLIQEQAERIEKLEQSNRELAQELREFEDASFD